MSKFNQITLVGRIGRQPELRETKGGVAVANFSLATDRYAKKGEEPITDWHRITCWDGQAKFVMKYCDVGTLILVSGELQYSKFTDKEGIERISADIIARNVQGLGKTKQAEGSRGDSQVESGNNHDAFNAEPPF